ncbi:unnamed protein product [Diamesa tonsa]
MNSNTAALHQSSGHHHHHHHQTTQGTSATTQQYQLEQAGSHYQHPGTQTQQPQLPINPSTVGAHRYNSTINDNPWLLQSQVQQQQQIHQQQAAVPTPPLRQHKRPAPHPPPSLSTSQTQINQLSVAPKPQHLTTSTYNQPPILFTSSQTQTTPGLTPQQILQQHSPKSPNQSFLHINPSVGTNIMSTSLNSNATSAQGNNSILVPTTNHQLQTHQQQQLTQSLHHSTSNLLTTSGSLLSNNNNNSNFDDLNLNNGCTSSLSAAAVSQKKLEVKLNAMPWFHGSISRDEAEHLLQPRDEGLFLVRESTNFPGDYTLCVCFQGKVEHYRVKYLDNKLTIDDEEYFENLGQLVAHYELDADGLCTQLIKSLPKKGRQEYCINSKDFIDKGWVIPEEDLQLKESIGKGEFGEVMLGYLKGVRVAVKMLKDSTAAAQKFLQEASVMTTLEHENLVKFIGLVLNNKHIYLVTEYMSKGSLVDYLRSRGRQHITRKDQINFACDTCAGMEYLEAKKVVHRDLAARNVLISEDCVAKVADFGLAREECYSLDVGKLPIKWTAPEALKGGRFSNKSDIWSFGILLWEIYSFGRVPYPRIPLAEVTKHVEMGYKMESPDGCPTEVYDMMRATWDLNPLKRPTFQDLKGKLMQLKAITT